MQTYLHIYININTHSQWVDFHPSVSSHIGTYKWAFCFSPYDTVAKRPKVSLGPLHWVCVSSSSCYSRVSSSTSVLFWEFLFAPFPLNIWIFWGCVSAAREEASSSLSAVSPLAHFGEEQLAHLQEAISVDLDYLWASMCVNNSASGYRWTHWVSIDHLHRFFLQRRRSYLLSLN